MTWTAGAASRSRRWSRAAASSRARRSAARSSSPACTSTPTPRSTRPSSCPMCSIGRNVRLSKVVIDSGVRIPDGLVVGEDPELDAKRFRRTEKRRLPDHPADDRQARAMSELQGPLRRVGDLPAGQDRRARRRGRRAARARSQREGVEMRTLVPGYPGGHGQARRRVDGARIQPISSAARRAFSRATRRASTCSRSTRRISSTGRATPISAPTGATGPTMPAASPRWRGSAPTSGSGAIGAFRPEVVHAHDWQAALAPAYLHYADGPRPGDGDHHPQPRLSGPLSGLDLRRARSARERADDRRRRIFWRRRLSEGRPPARRPHHHRLADLRARDHDAGVRHGARRAAARPRRRCSRHRQRHRRRGLESGHRRRAAAELQRAAHRHAGAQQDRAADPARAGAGREPAAVRRRLPPFGSEGPRPAAAGPAGSRRQGRPARAARLGRPGAGGGLRRCRGDGAGVRSAASSATTRSSPISSRPAPTSSSCRRASSLAA